MTADLVALTDSVAVLRMEALRWHSKALRVQDRQPEDAELFAETAACAQALADEAAEIALFRYCANRGQA